MSRPTGAFLRMSKSGRSRPRPDALHGKKVSYSRDPEKFLPRELGLREHREGELVVSVSAPERAALEFIQHLPPTDSEYEHANLLFEGLGTLRTDLDRKSTRLNSSHSGISYA